MSEKLTIGVLALQGDFDAHRRTLEKLGVRVILVRKPEQFDDIDGLIIPGGESTAFLRLLGEAGFEKLRDFVLHRPVFGTCAGCILLAREVENPQQTGLGAIDIRVRRNAYGRQIDSFIAQAPTKLGEIEMVFIRAPKIVDVGPQVDVLASDKGDPVLVQQGRVMAATFHPELSEDTAVHKRFVEMVQQALASSG